MPGDLAPARLILEVEADDPRVLLQRPLLLDDVRVQMVMPALSALLADATRQLIGNLGPVFCAVGEDETCQLGVFFLGPRG